MLTSQNEKLRKSASSNEHSQKTQIVTLNKTIVDLQHQVKEGQEQLKASAKTIETIQEEQCSLSHKLTLEGFESGIARQENDGFYNSIFAIVRTV